MQSAQSAPLRLSQFGTLHHPLTGKILRAVTATGLVALCAHISLPLPFTLVPLTLQTFAVVLIGMYLGPVAGFLSLALYLAEGASGLPVFNPNGPGGVAQLLGSTAGYLFSYPLAAALAGFAVRGLYRLHSRFTVAIIAGSLAMIPVFTLGAGWLAHLLHLPLIFIWHLAVTPFLFGEAIKITAAASIFSASNHWRQS